NPEINGRFKLRGTRKVSGRLPKRQIWQHQEEGAKNQNGGALKDRLKI
ncbi:MAG: hypothetical protein ACI9WR_001488, partial [Paracoccaceae bacterium]